MIRIVSLFSFPLIGTGKRHQVHRSKLTAIAMSDRGFGPGEFPMMAPA